MKLRKMKIRKIVAENGEWEETVYTTNLECETCYYFRPDFKIIADEKVENGDPVWLQPHWSEQQPHEMLRRRKSLLPIMK